MKFFFRKKQSRANSNTGDFIELPNTMGEGDGSPLIVERNPDLKRIFSDPNPNPPQRLTKWNREYWENLTSGNIRNILSMAYLMHPNPAVRREAIKFVENMNTLGVMQVFVDLLADPDVSVRKSAAVAIWENDNWKFTLQALCDEIRGYHTMGPVKTAAGLTLGYNKAMDALEFLVKEAPDEDARKEINEFTHNLIQKRISEGDQNLVNILEKFPIDQPARSDTAETSNSLEVEADTKFDDIIEILNNYCQDQSIDREERRKKAKEIGEDLFKKGGNSLMLEVHNLLQMQQSRPGAARLIESWWNGIGEWRG